MHPVNPPIIPFDIKNTIVNSSFKTKIENIIYKARKKQKLNQFIKNYSKLNLPQSKFSMSTTLSSDCVFFNITSTNITSVSTNSSDQLQLESTSFLSSHSTIPKSSIEMIVDDDADINFFVKKLYF